MKKLLLPIAVLAFFALPSVANAEQCRSQADGKFAKCGTPGAVPASKYIKKDGTKGKAMASAAKAAPAAKPAMAPAMAAKPAMAPAPAAKAGPCKDDKGKFIKCGAAAAPAKPAMAPAKPAPAAPAATPAKAAAAKPAKKTCKNDKGKFIKCAA